MRRPTRALLALLAPVLGAACASQPLGEPSTALARVEALAAEERHEEVSELVGRMLDSDEVSPQDKAEAAFLGGEAEMALGHPDDAFPRYRHVLENAAWSRHATAIEERLFEIGRTLLFDPEFGGWFDDRGRGVEALETLAAHFRTSDQADDALKLVGDYFAQPDVAEYHEAALAYLRVVDEHPASEWVEQCLWLAGHCRLLAAQGPRYDRNELLLAHELLRRSVEEHPRGMAIVSAREDLADVREQLAEAELFVADFYAWRGALGGERLRLANAWLLYPETGGGEAARVRLLELGVDLASLADDPRRQSLDKVVATRPLWETQRDDARNALLPGRGLRP